MDNVSHIENFLKKFKNLIPRGHLVKKQIIESVKKTTGIEICADETEFRGGVFYIKKPQKEKSFIFLNKKNILDDARAVLKEKTPKDIR